MSSNSAVDSNLDDFGQYGDVSVKLGDDHVAVVEIHQIPGPLQV